MIKYTHELCSEKEVDVANQKTNNTKYPSDAATNRINIYVGDDAEVVAEVRERVGNLSEWFRKKIHEELENGDSEEGSTSQG